MGKFVVTEEMLKKAKTYVPFQEKEEFCDMASQRCIRRVQINLTDETGSPMPDMWMEDSGARARFMMTALVLRYLGVKGAETDDGGILTETAFDFYAGSHILNQLDRMKGIQSVRDIIFDILNDYRGLEKKLNVMVYGMLTVMNDPINRMFQKLGTDTSEATLEAQKKALEDAKQELEELLKNREDLMIDVGGAKA